ncbi:MAG: MarC family protein [Candidatus Omnitrophica bacterium]|nr:MarC family protein [Candidatus Omnitrophota bacterium]
MGIVSAMFVSFCALFIALDAIGLLPKFNLFAQEIPPKEIKKKLIGSVYLAAAIVVGVLIASRIIAWLLGLSSADFQIGAGIILFVLSIYYLLKPESKLNFNPAASKILPLATPIIISPSVIAMILVLMGSYGLIITSLSFAANMVLVYIVFRNATKLQTVLGANGVALLSKTVDILLGVFAIMLIKNGVIAIFVQFCAKNRY